MGATAGWCPAAAVLALASFSCLLIPQVTFAAEAAGQAVHRNTERIAGEPFSLCLAPTSSSSGRSHRFLEL
jgi:hypothetical protein